MAEQDLKQAMLDAITDADSLERFINGPDSETVLTRLSAKYPTLQKAIKQMFENGGLPATPFKTKAEMDASSLAVNSYAIVTNDPVVRNNGLYLKNGVSWDAASVKLSSIDDIKLLVKMMFRDMKDEAQEIELTYKDFYIWGGMNYKGETPSNIDRYKRTEMIKVYAGDTLEFTHFWSVSGHPFLIYFDEKKQIVGTEVASTPKREYQTFKKAINKDGYVVAQHSLHDYNMPYFETDSLSLKITRSDSLYITQSDLTKRFVTGFKPITLPPNLNLNSVPTSSNMRAETLYKGDASHIHLKRMNGIYLGFAEGDTAEQSENTQIRFFGESFISVPLNKSKKYITVYASGSAALDNPDYLSKMAYFETKNATIFDLKNEARPFSGTGASTPIFSTYRTPSLATGGMLSIIDDDGRAEAYTELYPYCKERNIPFGIAVTAGAIGSTFEGRTAMTLVQLKDMARDRNLVDVLSHGWVHRSQENLSREHSLEEILLAKQWFAENGIHNVNAFALPYGKENPKTLAILQQHYNAVYDYGGPTVGINKMDTISNYRIERFNFPMPTVKDSMLPYFKSKIDEAVELNAWVILTTHIGHPSYWMEGSFECLQEIVDYAKTKGMKIELPSVGFQTFGNIVENDSGFKIQANGKIVGAA